MRWQRVRWRTGAGGLKDKKPKPRTFIKIAPDKLRKYMGEHPDAYQVEVAGEFGCSKTAVQKALKRIGYTRKKTQRYMEQDSQKVEEYLKKLAAHNGKTVAYVDETGVDTYLHREYGYAPKGQEVIRKVCGRKYRREGIVAALVDGAAVEPMVYEGTMAHGLFEAWFSKRLLPALPRDAVVVMDNASFHRKDSLEKLAKEASVPSSVLSGTESHRALLGVVETAA